MNLLADENVDRPIVERLRRDGHQVMYIVEMRQGFLTTKSLLKQIQRTAF